jgi:hypothetical protein
MDGGYGWLVEVGCGTSGMVCLVQFMKCDVRIAVTMVCLIVDWKSIAIGCVAM